MYLRKLTALSFMSVLAFGACTGEDDIDRTQPNRLPKSMFSGTWYIRSTVTGVPGTSASSFIGQTGTLEKIRWDIQENHLLAYRAYEEIPGTDSHGRDTEDDPNYRENPIAAFRIDSHFDVKREYNPATGEQTNVISENSSDRPWFERDYIRVDWSQSELDAQQFSGAAGQVPYKAVFYVQQHEDDPDAMRLIGKDGGRLNFDDLETIQSRKPGEWKDEVSYFDMVGRFLLEPERVTYDFGDGTTAQIPLCYFIRYGGANHQTTSCGPAEVKVRTAFLKTELRNYEPVPLPDRDMAKFGFFRTERFTWDRRYGFTEAGRIYLANVHNIWQKAFETNEDGTFKLGQDGKFVRIPLDKRVAKPIVYHLSEDFPCELVGTAQQIAGSWNRAMRRAVAVSQGVIDKTTGDSEVEMDAVPRDRVPDMFTIHLNGWVQKNPGSDFSCSNLTHDPAAVEARLGDLRFNVMAWVHDRQITGPLGYGPSSADPETGEIIAGMAHVYGAAVDEYSNRALEIVRTLNNDLTVDDVVSGEYVRDWVLQNSPVMDPKNLPAELAAMGAESIQRSMIGEKLQAKVDAIRVNGFEPVTIGGRQTRIDLLKSSPLADYLLDEEIVRGMAPTVLAGQAIGAGDEIPRSLRDQLSPLAWASPDARAVDKMRRELASKKCIWLAEFSDDAVQGLASEVWQKYYQTGQQSEYDAMWQYLREIIFRGVMEHEVGHTLGLRHNFAGSYDSINYFDKYWELRAQPDEEGNGGLKERDPLDEQNGGLNLGETYAQAKMTEAQKAGRMHEYEYSTIMDYGAKFNSDVHGIGKYDEAAILFGYTGYVEVFGAPPDSGKQVLRSRYSDCKARFESAPNLAYTPILEDWHYSSVWNLLGRTEGLRTRRFRRWADVRGEQQYAVDACKSWVANGGTIADFTSQSDMDRDLEVPFMFCSDEFVDATVGCHRWDQGADPLEIVNNVVSSYNSYYFFNNYKRGRFAFDAYSIYQRVSTRYFSYLPNIYQHWLFRVAVYGVDDVALANYWTLGTYNGFNLLMDTISKPSYGTYCLYDKATDECSASTGTVWARVNDTTTPAADESMAVIGRGVGRRHYSRYDFDSGYYYQNQLVEAGHFWEYLAALEALTNSSGVFVGVETGTDFTRYLVPYYIAFEDELTKFFEGAVTDNYATYAPRINDRQVETEPAATLEVVDNRGLRFKLNPATGEVLPSIRLGRPIDLDNNFTTKFYTLVQGMSEFRSLYSLRFADRQQVFRVGSGQQVTPAPGKEVYSCQDPIGGHVYGTLRDTNPVAGVDEGAAVKMVGRCRDEVATYNTLAATRPSTDRDVVLARQAMNSTIEWLNFMRSLYEMFGRNI